MARPRQKILFLAQLPPPFHGQSVITREVHGILNSQPDTEVRHLWLGGARGATDVGKRSFSKYLQFLMMLTILAGNYFSGRRFDTAYLGFAPWAHTAIRDAILMYSAKLLARRVWVHVHGDGLAKFTHPETIRDRFVSSALKNTEVIAITTSQAKKARQSGLFSWVHHLPNFSGDPGENPISASKGKIHIGTVGNLDPRKGVLDFVDTIALLKTSGLDVRGSIVGGPTKALSVEKLREYVSASGLEETIEVTGRVSEEEKSQLLKSFDVFLYLSRHDLAPLAVIEAISHGCVPVVVATGGIPEIIGTSLQKNVISEEASTAQVADQSAEIISGYAKSATMLRSDSQKARKQYLKTFSREGFKNNIIALLVNETHSVHDPGIRSEAGEVL